ncbi:MAG TPA: 4-hydroxy-tetrahydrodipicolinate synthase [Steroidobacteraceae bacterium]|nr:4-hydroxy-tetrahydrodipicolinate synthase [Steroidobacteraceae bacterium]
MFSGSMVAVVTPMTDDGGIDAAAWRRLVEWHIAEGTDAIVVAGTTGESPTLSAAEVAGLTEQALEAAADRIPVIVGTGTNSTAGTVERTRALSGLGAAGVLIVTPYYNRPSQEGLYRHFMAAAEVSQAPVILYNVPSRTAVDLLPATVARLAAHPRIVAVKEAAGQVGRVRDILERSRESFAVIAGEDSIARQSMLAGARGVISVTANVAPRAMREMCAAATGGDEARAEKIDATLADLHLKLFLEANPIPVKWALAEMGMIGRGLRLPLTPLAEEHHAPVRMALQRAGALK